MKVPKVIDVFGKEYMIKAQEKIIHNGHESLGLIDLDAGEIFLSTDQSLESLKSTLLHELFHGVVDRLGLHNVGLSEDAEEILVEGLAVFIHENFEFSFRKK
jgi:Zn-dependent peptidase ImmA (M78 family)